MLATPRISAKEVRGDPGCRAPCLTSTVPLDVPRRRSVQREVDARLRRLVRKLADDLERLRIEAGVTQAAVAREAGVDRTFYGRIARGEAHPSLETIVALGTALGADASVRLWSGAGPRLVDRLATPMTDRLLAQLHPVWLPHLEVPVWRPARGVVDLVLERRDDPLLVVGECQSVLTRLEQIVRWSQEKADSIGSSSLVGEGSVPPTSRLLVVRSTVANREIARTYERLLRVAYPAPTSAVIDALTSGSAWPGAGIVWVRVERGRAELLAAPPRGVDVGR